MPPQNFLMGAMHPTKNFSSSISCMVNSPVSKKVKRYGNRPIESYFATTGTNRPSSVTHEICKIIRRYCRILVVCLVFALQGSSVKIELCMKLASLNLSVI